MYITPLIKHVMQIILNPPLNQMVFKKFVSFFYNLIGIRRQLRIKDVALSESTKLDVSEKSEEGSLRSPGRSSSSSKALHVEGGFCCVCLSMVGEEEDMQILPCMHKFHKVCIDRWFNVCGQKTCPVCRFAVGEEERCNKREEQLTEEMVIWFSSFHVAGF